MSSVRPDVQAVPSPKADSLSAWADGHAGVILAATACACVLETVVPVAIAAVTSFSIFAHRAMPSLGRLKLHGNEANQLTALRLGIVLCAAVAVELTVGPWLLIAFAVNVILDVSDGYVARRLGQASEAGTIFDRETDAIAMLTVYFHFISADDRSAWLIAPGVLPYLYRLFTRYVLERPEPERRQRLAAALAGVNYGVLLAALAAQPPYRDGLLVVSITVVLGSFTVSLARRFAHGRTLH